MTSNWKIKPLVFIEKRNNVKASITNYIPMREKKQMNDRFVVCRIDSAGTKWYYTGCHYKPWMTGYINAIEFGTKETADKMAAQMAGKTVEAIMDGSGEIVVISDSRASIFLR